MSRNTGADCRQCRREGQKLLLKGTRCYTEKCALDRRGYGPGQHGNSKGKKKISQYGIQLREKQKLRRYYCLSESQFNGYFHDAARKRGVTGENFIKILESRLDNVVYRMGFALSRKQSRQLINQGHILVNGKKVDIPSYLLKIGDTVEIKSKSRSLLTVTDAINTTRTSTPQSWLEVDYDNCRGKVQALPAREDLDFPIREELIVEFYSK